MFLKSSPNQYPEDNTLHKTTDSRLPQFKSLWHLEKLTLFFPNKITFVRC